MCGIAGVVSADPGRLDAVDAMVASLAHRGPDDSGVVRLDGVTLGHRRLSILDLQTGHQPMFLPGNAVGIVFNGEIYNYPDLRRQLESEGRAFRTRSDTEAILHLYDAYGDACVDHLDGMFAFAIWDARRRRLLLARDHLGQKPLFYAQGSDFFAFASEPKAFLASKLLAPRVDVEALYHYISLRFIPDRLTLFEGICKLPAAHYLRFEGGAARLEKYWSFSFVAKEPGAEAEHLDRLDHELRRTVRAHLLSDVPVGTFLSGGIDSSLITAMTAGEAPGPVPTFSIGVKEEGFNELPWARRVAERWRTEHHEEVVSADLVRLVPRMVHHLDEPADPFAVGVYLVSGIASKAVKVVLSGDGGDELFAGYDRFAGQRLADLLGWIPATLRRNVVAGLIDALPESFAYKGLTQKLRWMNHMSLLAAGERYAESMGFLRFTEEAKRSLFTPAIRARLGDADSREKILEHFESRHAADVVDRMLYTDLMTRMPDHLLPTVDRMAMAHGLEVRPPLLEHRMVEFCARIPASLKLRGTTLKYLLRRLAERYVDPEVVRRPKQGFGFPLAYWMRNELRDFLRRSVSESQFVEAGIFERPYVESLVEEHIAGKRDHNYRIWILLNLEVWHRLYVDGRTPEEVEAWIASART